MNAPPTRRRSHWHPASVVAALVWTICVGQGPVPLAAADSVTVGWRSDSLRPTDSWNTLSLDMRITRKHIGQSGAPVGSPTPSAAYRIERSSLSGGWRTVITVLAVDRAPAYSLSGTIAPPGAFPVARLEDDEDGTPVRAYDTGGRLLTPFASGASRPVITSITSARSSGREWIDALVATPSQKTRRLQTLERQFGRASSIASSTGSLSRFSRWDGDLFQEVLVDPNSGVPVEHNKSRGGKLIVHRTFMYGPASSGAMVRTAVHSETLVSSDSDERAVVDTAFSNIRLEQRR